MKGLLQRDLVAADQQLDPIGLQQRIIQVVLQVLDGKNVRAFDDARTISILGGWIAPLLEEKLQQFFQILV